jgi:hypothetical protein
MWEVGGLPSRLTGDFLRIRNETGRTYSHIPNPNRVTLNIGNQWKDRAALNHLGDYENGLIEWTIPVRWLVQDIENVHQIQTLRHQVMEANSDYFSVEKMGAFDSRWSWDEN